MPNSLTKPSWWIPLGIVFVHFLVVGIGTTEALAPQVGLPQRSQRDSLSPDRIREYEKARLKEVTERAWYNRSGDSFINWALKNPNRVETAIEVATQQLKGWRGQVREKPSYVILQIAKTKKSRARLALRAIIPLLQDESKNVRQEVLRLIRSLVEINDSLALQALRLAVTYLKDPQEDVRFAADIAIVGIVAKKATIGPRAVKLVLPLLKDPKWFIKDRALKNLEDLVKALSALATQELFDEVRPLLKDKSWNVRSSAVRCLSMLMVASDPLVPQGLQELTSTLHDGSGRVRFSVMNGLTDLGEKHLGLVEEIRQILLRRYPQEKIQWVKNEIEQALEHLDYLDGRLLQQARQRYQNEAGDLAQWVGQSRLRAAVSLHLLSMELGREFEPNSDVPVNILNEILYILGEFSDVPLEESELEEYIERIVERLFDENDEVQMLALDTLISMDARQDLVQVITNKLWPWLDHEDEFIQARAIDVFDELIREDWNFAQPQLLEKMLTFLSLGDSGVYVRSAAVFVMQTIARVNWGLIEVRGRENIRQALQNFLSLEQDTQLGQELLYLLDSMEYGVTISPNALAHDTSIRDTTLASVPPVPLMLTVSFHDLLNTIRTAESDRARQEATQGLVTALEKQPQHKKEVMTILRDKSEPEGLRWRLAVALRTVKRDPEILNLLENLAADSQEKFSVRQAAVHSLGYLAQRRSRPVLESIKQEAENKINESKLSEIRSQWEKLHRLAEGAIRMIDLMLELTEQQEITRDPLRERELLVAL